MNRTRYLLKNTAILFISNFASKILVFFLLPLYTTVLTTAEYGISDIITTTVNLLYIFLTLYVSSGILRYTMDSTTDTDEMFSIGLLVVLVSSILVASGTGLVYILHLVPVMEPFLIYLVLIYITHCTNSMLISFAKGRERIRLIGISGIVATAVRLISNILLLLVIRMSIRGYLISSVLSYMSGTVVFLLGGVLTSVHFREPSVVSLRKLIRYSAPIAATEVGWLICTSSDKYIVSFMLGASATGLISAAHRLPTILTAFTSVFIQAWSISAIKEYENQDKARYYTRMFNYYNAFAISVGAVLILCSRIIGGFLFKGEFVTAWIYTPIYLTALVINTMSSFSGSIISAGTDTRPLFTSTVSGALLNILLDVFLIRWMGIYGAGIATAISYLLIGTMRMRTVKRSFDIDINYRKVFLQIILLCILTAAMINSETPIFAVGAVLLCIVILALNRRQLKEITSMLWKFGRTTMGRLL